MKTIKSFIIILTISIVMISCNDKAASDFVDTFESQRLNVLINENPREAIKYIDNQMTVSNDEIVRHLGYYYKSLAYRYISNDTALSLAQRALTFFKLQPPSPSLSFQIARIYNDISCLYGDINISDSVAFASEMAYKYLQKSNQLPDYLISYGFNLINANNASHNYSKSIQLAKEVLFKADSLSISETEKTPVFLSMVQIYSNINKWHDADSLLQIIDNHYDELDWRNKKYYFNINEKIASIKNNTYDLMYYSKEEFLLLQQVAKENKSLENDLFYCKLNIAQSYALLLSDNEGNIDSAFYYLDLCKNNDLYENDASFHTQVSVIEMLMYYSLEEYHKAAEILEDSLNIALFDNSEPSVRKNRLEIGNFVYNKIGEFEKAKTLYYERCNLNDSVLKAEISNQINALSDKYEQNIKMLTLKNENQHFKLNIVILVASLVILLIVLLYLKKKKDVIIEKSRNKLATIKLESVRSRIAPHFILNVLNRNIVHKRNNDGIDETQDLIHILHSNLELVKKDVISLREELEFINLYIKLEANGLGDDFHPLTEIDEHLDLDKIQIPSMMLQIFVENAIKHGLRNKEGKRCLWLRINEIEDERHHKFIRYVILDNGGGFRPSRSKVKDSTHTGMLIIRETVMFFNAKNRQKINYLINTVDVGDGETGCQVTLDIPEKYDFGLIK